MEIKDVEKLAELAKIELTEEEKIRLIKDMDSILDYVKQIEEIEFITDIANQCSTPDEIPGFKWLRQYPDKARIEIALSESVSRLVAIQ